ncbi:nucleolus and neural progenitor protein isoform X2 [Heterodontus francisci]|uniref:nucleolus and neural progenitor protein isoform X2 n=1 Tax=Heterodontus francisci TaxID=7792 RepID=UPI00355BF1CA
MAVERWNAVEIPFPGTGCSVAVPACSSSDGCIQDLVSACESVLKALRSKLLTVELNVLCSLLYVFHNRLRQHKPYLALKQVEQCLKRLHNMQLEGSIQDLIKLCPRVLFRSILISLDVLYDKLILLLNEVTKIQHMTYVKEFSFPVSIRQWLGLSYSKVIQMKLPSVSSQMSEMPSGKLGLLDKLFSEPEPLLLEDKQDAKSGDKMNDNIIPKANRILDIGLAVQDQRLGEIETRMQLGFEMKSLRAHSHNCSENIQKFVRKFNCRRSKKNKQPLPLDEFVRRISATQTFSILCWELKTILHWFRRRKLKHETCYLGYQLLRCHRLRMVEALGYSFPRKIHFIKMAVCRYLAKRFQGTLHHKNCKSTVTHLKKCTMRQSKLYKVLPRRRKSSLKKKWIRVRLDAKKGSKRTLQTTPHFAFDTQTAVKKQGVTGDMPAELVGNSGQYQNLKNMTVPLVSSGGGSAVVQSLDDIDDIFASIGI